MDYTSIYESGEIFTLQYCKSNKYREYESNELFVFGSFDKFKMQDHIYSRSFSKKSLPPIPISSHTLKFHPVTPAAW